MAAVERLVRMRRRNRRARDRYGTSVWPSDAQHLTWACNDSRDCPCHVTYHGGAETRRRVRSTGWCRNETHENKPPVIKRGLFSWASFLHQPLQRPACFAGQPVERIFSASPCLRGTYVTSEVSERRITSTGSYPEHLPRIHPILRVERTLDGLHHFERGAMLFGEVV